ncbi:hypothetical protein [Candidatus Enterococcus courvalinii]|uniref:ComK protein n=1 Tax=Candidatus Enterococcus courvalinii TaxID=2815329 RepID=A0ABS3HYB9_9ENTE|nr:hypothetical protein [Enterococcus sp. MSG2901]MBO0481454.1 hypothetical protein [Enterococcus sp. MSG2901]
MIESSKNRFTINDFTTIYCESSFVSSIESKETFYKSEQLYFLYQIPLDVEIYALLPDTTTDFNRCWIVFQHECMLVASSAQEIITYLLDSHHQLKLSWYLKTMRTLLPVKHYKLPAAIRTQSLLPLESAKRVTTIWFNPLQVQLVEEHAFQTTIQLTNQLRFLSPIKKRNLTKRIRLAFSCHLMIHTDFSPLHSPTFFPFFPKAKWLARPFQQVLAHQQHYRRGTFFRQYQQIIYQEGQQDFEQ